MLCSLNHRTKCLNTSLQSCIVECCWHVMYSKGMHLCDIKCTSHFLLLSTYCRRKYTLTHTVRHSGQRVVTIHLSSFHPLAWPSCQWTGWSLSSGPSLERWKGDQRRTVWGFSACQCQRCWCQFHFHQCPIPWQRRETHWTGRGPSSQRCLTSQLWICPQPPSGPTSRGVSKWEQKMKV